MPFASHALAFQQRRFLFCFRSGFRGNTVFQRVKANRWTVDIAVPMVGIVFLVVQSRIRWRAACALLAIQSYLFLALRCRNGCGASRIGMDGSVNSVRPLVPSEVEVVALTDGTMVTSEHATIRALDWIERRR